MRATIFLIFLLLETSIFFNNAKIRLQVRAKYTSDFLSKKIVIINSFDPMFIKARNNKRGLLRELTDSLKNYLAKTIKEQTGDEAILIQDIMVNTGNQDSIVFSLMEQNNADKAILIQSSDVYFEETGVEETTDIDGGVKNITSFDLCAINKYALYGREKILQKSIINKCEFFTTRNAGKGHFRISIGPNVVSQKKHTFGIVERNAEKYISEISMKLKTDN